MILLDCDGATSVAEAALRPAVSTFGWEPPECAQLNFATKATDVYKLGLAVLRCLNPEGAGATIKDPKRLAGQLDAAGVALMDAGAQPGSGAPAAGEGAVPLPAGRAERPDHPARAADGATAHANAPSGHGRACAVRGAERPRGHHHGGRRRADDRPRQRARATSGPRLPRAGLRAGGPRGEEPLRHGPR